MNEDNGVDGLVCLLFRNTFMACILLDSDGHYHLEIVFEMYSMCQQFVEIGLIWIVAFALGQYSLSLKVLRFWLSTLILTIMGISDECSVNCPSSRRPWAAGQSL